MPTATFEYKVRDRAGKLTSGKIDAESQAQVATKLKSMGYAPLSITEANSGMGKEISIPGLSRKKKIKLKDLAVFSRQFATMINSGLSLLRALYILAEQTENPALAKVVDEVRQDVEKGASLSQALSRHPKVFSRLYVAMVRAGETGGVLDSVLLQLASVIEKSVELRRKIKSAMTYPTVVFCLCLLIVAAMLLFIVPTFKDIYSQLGGTLPVLTRVLISISTAFKKFFPVFIVLGGLGVWGFK